MPPLDDAGGEIGRRARGGAGLGHRIGGDRVETTGRILGQDQTAGGVDFKHGVGDDPKRVSWREISGP